MKNICISAIHTNAGKTCVSAALCEAFGYEYFKLVQAGNPTDKNFIEKTSKNIKTHNPGIMLQTAASPHVGMKNENIKFKGLQIPLPKDKNILIELAGGLYCPLDEEDFMIDYIEKYNLPTFLVVRDYLGSINHTMLSVNALKSKNIKILGIIISKKTDLNTSQYLMKKLKDINFFFLKDIELGFEKAALDLKNQILNSNIKDFL